MKRLILTLTTLAIAGGAAFAESLKVYTEVSPPQQIQGADGKLTGIAIDAVREIQKRIGNADPIEVVPWARGYQEVQSDPNVVLFTMARTGARNSLFKWVGPVDESVYYFYVKSDSTTDIKSMDEAKKLHSIGVYKNDFRDLELTKAGFANLDRATDNATNAKKLILGRVDAIAASPSEIPDLAKAAGCKASDLKQSFPFLKIQLFLAFSKATPDATVKAWSDALDAMKKDKTFEQIYRKYEPTKALPSAAKTTF